MSTPDSLEQIKVGQYTAEMQALMNRLAAVPTEPVDFTQPPTAESRKLDEANNAIWNVDLPDVARVRHFTIEPHSSLDAVACNAVVYEPVGATDGLIFYVHGGGWAYMNLATHDRFMRVLCNMAGKTVVGVHYRLAPEAPFPAGLTDVVSAYRSIISSRRDLGLPDGPVVIAGDSAGGNLAMATMLHEIDAGRELPAGALLLYGVLGADFGTPSYRAYGDDYILTEAIMRQLWDWYAPDEETRRNAHANPIMASDEQLRALPPLFLLVAELDPLASDTHNMKARLDALGRKDEIYVEPGVIHGFLIMTAELEAAGNATQKAAEAANAFMAGAVGKS